MNKKKKKILDIYAKNSTPEELFSTVMELIEKLADRINSVSLKVPDEMAITDIVKPLIPQIPKVINGRDGKTPTSKELTELILPLIPEPKPGEPGKDGNIIEAKEIRDKLTELKGDDRLSVYALKDLEWLAQYKQQIQWNAAGSLTVDEVNALISAAAGKGSIISATDSGDHKTYNLASPITSNNFYAIINNGMYTPDDLSFPFTAVGSTLTFSSALPTDLASTIIKIVCV